MRILLKFCWPAVFGVFISHADASSAVTNRYEAEDALLTGMTVAAGTPGWTNADYTVTGTNINYGVDKYDAVTNLISTEAKDVQFIRLVVE